ncbi:MAG: hypothetical protein IAE78_25350 [Myxococcus sp.]|nr:hypothetical protein [Myxococcus sp.]
MKQAWLLGLSLVVACAQRGPPDAGIDAATESPRDAATDSASTDAGDPLGRFTPPANWLDGGGRASVLDVWESDLAAYGPCYVTAAGRLFFASPSVAVPGLLRMVLASPGGVAPVGDEYVIAKIVLADESFTWCGSEPPGGPIRCKRYLNDGGTLIAPSAVFDLDTWTASGFISGLIRNGRDLRRVGAVWAPDGGYWQVPETSTLMSESGLGTGQLQLPDGGRFAFLWDDGRQIPLGTSIPEYSSWGAAVNSRGLVVGQRFAGGNKMAVFWGRETATGRPGELIAVNERGLAVGQERWRAESAALWYRGAYWRLDELTDAGVGCRYTGSSSVNDRDQIAAIRECPQTFFRRCALIQLRVSD